MTRVVVDTYFKKDKPIWDSDTNNPSIQEFNCKIIAVNDMYDRLYKEGILRKVSFEFKDYSDTSFFALDVKDLEPYRSEMEKWGVKYGMKDADLAVKHIFDEEYTPCQYSGAIQLGWTMNTYRDVDGSVGRSWESGLVQGLGYNAIADLPYITAEKGVKEAVRVLFERCKFEPDLFDKACEYYQDFVDLSDKDNREFFEAHADKLIYCYENKKDMMDFDFWVQYEILLGEKITYDECVVIDDKFDGDPHDVEGKDVDVISAFRNGLKEYRDNVVITQGEMDELAARGEARLKQEAKEDMRSLADKIKVAEDCLADKQSVKEFVFDPRDYEEAKAALLASKNDSMYWKNDGYACRLEREDTGEIYYDLHLTRDGTTVMYGEAVEFLSEEPHCVCVRVPDSKNEKVFISRDFFEKNFTPCTVPERDKMKENIEQER